MFDNEKRLCSDTKYFFLSFIGIRGMLSVLLYAIKSLDVNNYGNNIELMTNSIISVIYEGVEIILNLAIPVPFIKFSLDKAESGFDFTAGIIFLIAFGISLYLYKRRKQSYWREYY
jgi:hypothetical protein